MARKTRSKLVLSNKEILTLETISNSRTSAASKVQRAKILLDYFSGLSIAAITKKYI